MPLVLKSGTFSLFKKVGIPQTALNALTKAGVKLSLGYKDFSLLSSEGKTLASGTLPVSSNELMKGLANSEDMAASAQIISNAISIATGTSTVSTLGELLKTKLNQVKETSTPAPAPAPAPVVAHVPVPNTPVSDVIPLRDAQAMYQRVKGTSNGSVYVVVAMAPKLKVAARVHGNAVSLRVEGEPSDADKKRLISQTFTQKDKVPFYMSAHFTCENVPPERVVGAVLIGSGIKFDTPIPDMTKVRALCK